MDKEKFILEITKSRNIVTVFKSQKNCRLNTDDIISP